MYWHLLLKLCFCRGRSTIVYKCWRSVALKWKENEENYDENIYVECEKMLSLCTHWNSKNAWWCWRWWRWGARSTMPHRPHQIKSNYNWKSKCNGKDEETVKSKITKTKHLTYCLVLINTESAFCMSSNESAFGVQIPNICVLKYDVWDIIAITCKFDCALVDVIIFVNEAESKNKKQKKERKINADP